MKPFSLEEYLANPSRKVVTRDGRQVRIIEIGLEGDYPIVALIKAYDNSEVPHRYTNDGLITSCGECNLDLFFSTINRDGFVNIYNRDNKYITGVTIHETEEEAKRFIFQNSGYITTIRVEWEE